MYWVFHLSIGRNIRGCTNSTCVQLCIPSILCPYSGEFSLRFTIISLKLLIRKVRGRKSSICVQLCIPIFLYASFFKVISLMKNLIIQPR